RGGGARGGLASVSQPRRDAVAGGGQFGAVLGGVVDRPGGVDDPARRQVPGGGGHRLTGGQAVRVLALPQLPALLEYFPPAAAVDGAVHPASAQQRRVRRVDPRVAFLTGEGAAHRRY